MGASESAERFYLKCNCILNFVTSEGNLVDYISFNPLVRENKALRKDTVAPISDKTMVKIQLF